MKNTYNMTNVEIVKEVHSGFTAYMVYADTERFGAHQIMAQCISKEEAEKWCRDNGVEIEQPTAWEMAEKEVGKSYGKIQIGNTMYRRLYIENGHIFGYSPSWYGFRDITEMITDCKMVGDGIGKTRERIYSKFYGRTVKFGNKCTW